MEIFLFDISANGDHRTNVILHNWPVVKKDDKGNILWKHEEDRIAYTQGDVDKVQIYAQVDGKLVAVEITGKSIKALAEKIKEIEAVEGAEYWEE